MARQTGLSKVAAANRLFRESEQRTAQLKAKWIDAICAAYPETPMMQIAAAVGVTRQRVAQIITSRAEAEAEAEIARINGGPAGDTAA